MRYYSLYSNSNNYPVCCVQGVKQLVLSFSLWTKIANSGDLGTRVSCKCNKSVEKLASVYLESTGMAYKHHK